MNEVSGGTTYYKLQEARKKALGDISLRTFVGVLCSAPSLACSLNRQIVICSRSSRELGEPWELHGASVDRENSGIACSVQVCAETNNAWAKGRTRRLPRNLAMGENDDASRHKVYL